MEERTIKRVTKEEFDKHVAEMKAKGFDGKAPKSQGPRINVRELVENL